MGSFVMSLAFAAAPSASAILESGNLGRRALLLATALAAATMMMAIGHSSPAHADAPDWVGLWRVNHAPAQLLHDDDDDDGGRVAYAPQYSATTSNASSAEQDNPVPVARGLPYGFNRGTCDRGQIGASPPGALSGAPLVEGRDGRNAAPLDLGCMAGALAFLPDSRAIAWRGEAGRDYRLMPVSSFAGRDGRTCREYAAAINTNGVHRSAIGTACQQSDGQWRVVD
jgi:hypothetical protein